MSRFLSIRRMDKPARIINSFNELIGSHECEIESGYRYYFSCKKEPSPIKIGRRVYKYAVVCNKFPFEGGKGEETVIGYCTRPIIV